jgi:hypothetical protein
LSLFSTDENTDKKRKEKTGRDKPCPYRKEKTGRDKPCPYSYYGFVRGS